MELEPDLPDATPVNVLWFEMYVRPDNRPDSANNKIGTIVRAGIMHKYPAEINNVLNWVDKHGRYRRNECPNATYIVKDMFCVTGGFDLRTVPDGNVVMNRHADVCMWIPEPSDANACCFVTSTGRYHSCFNKITWAGVDSKQRIYMCLRTADTHEYFNIDSVIRKQMGILGVLFMKRKHKPVYDLFVEEDPDPYAPSNGDGNDEKREDMVMRVEEREDEEIANEDE